MGNDAQETIKQFAYLYKDGDGQSQIQALGGEITKIDLCRSQKFSRDAAYLQSFVSNFVSLRRDFESISDIEQTLITARQKAPSILHSAMVETLFAQAEAQRCLSNFLSSAAAFRDRTLTGISRKYGNPSAELSYVKGVISAEYDANLSYRVLYNLRNFAMHEEAPIGLMPISYRRGEDDKPVLSVSVMLNKADLVSSSDVNKNVRKELSRLDDETFDVGTLAQEYFGSHRRILSALMEMHLPALKAEYEYFDAIYQRGGIVDGAAPVVLEAVKIGDGLEMKMLHLPMEMIDFFEYIEAG